MYSVAILCICPQLEAGLIWSRLSVPFCWPPTACGDLLLFYFLQYWRLNVIKCECKNIFSMSPTAVCSATSPYSVAFLMKYIRNILMCKTEWKKQGRTENRPYSSHRFIFMGSPRWWVVKFLWWKRTTIVLSLCFLCFHAFRLSISSSFSSLELLHIPMYTQGIL